MATLTQRHRLGRLLATARTLRFLLAKSCKHGTPCGNTCIAPGKVCKAGGAVDPKVDEFFPASKYPEFASYKPEMTDEEAVGYVEVSAVKSELFHATPSAAREKSIREEGVGPFSDNVAFAKGHYMAADAGYAGEFGSRIVPQHALIKNPKKFEDIDDFRDWQDHRQISIVPEKYRAVFSTLELLEAGHDGIHLARDNNGRPDSESWLAFHPKQVVSLKKK